MGREEYFGKKNGCSSLRQDQSMQMRRLELLKQIECANSKDYSNRMYYPSSKHKEDIIPDMREMTEGICLERSMPEFPLACSGNTMRWLSFSNPERFASSK